MSKRTILHLCLAIALGIAYALYYVARGTGPGAVFVGIAAAVIGGFIVQAWQPPSDRGRT